MDVLVFIVSGTLAAATALIFAAMGELVAEKSGMLNLGIEGMMATGAAMGFVALSVSGSYTVGFLAAAVLGCVLSLVHAAVTLVFRANQTASGLAIGILGLGLSSAIGKQYEGKTVAGLPELDLGPLSDIPLLGPMLFQQDVMVYLGIVLILATAFVLNRTKLGLVIRAIKVDHGFIGPVFWRNFRDHTLGRAEYFSVSGNKDHVFIASNGPEFTFLIPIKWLFFSKVFVEWVRVEGVHIK